MNTSAGYYQAPRPPRVPLDEVLIKLHPEGFHQEFEADGINVGAGGISMRASVLPEVGSTLRCELDHPTGGEAIEMIGRVVWAHESGPHVGEFGIRFTHLSAVDQSRIEALIQRWGRTSAKAPTVRLQLDGVGSAIVAEIQSERDDSLTVEQPLPFLAIGSAMVNETTGRRGRLEAVELEMDEETPKLVLSIGYEAGQGLEADDEAEARDTMPDAPPVIRASQPVESKRAQDTPKIVRYDRGDEAAAGESSADRLRAYVKSATDQLASSVGSVRAAVTDGVVPRAHEKVRELIALIGRFIGALLARLDEKPRRKQVPRSEAARAHLKNSKRSGRKPLIAAAIVCAMLATGWGAYLIAAPGGEAPTESATATEPAPAPAPAPEAAPPPAEASAPEPADEQIAIQGAPLPPKPVRGTSFGAESVAGGEKYVLRMSNPVVEMDGIIEEDGFSVSIPGSLSLSRAGPIAAAHPDIEHAGILNRGDYSELTLRVVAGRQPAYRGEAQDATIEVTVAR